MKRLQKNSSGFSIFEVLVVVVVLGLLGAVGYFVYQRQVKKPAAGDTAKTAKTNVKEAVFLRQSQTIESAWQQSYKTINFDTMKLEDYTKDEVYASPDKKKIAKVEDKKVYVTDAAKQDFRQVFPSAANEPLQTETSVSWSDDNKALIVVVTKTTRSGDGGPGSIPANTQTVYAVTLADGKVTKSFEHSEVYGGIGIIGTNMARDEIYWNIAGEGGPRANFNISKLSTGKLIKNADTEFDAYDTTSRTLINGKMYYSYDVDGHQQQIKAFDPVSGTNEVIYDTGPSPKETDADGYRAPYKRVDSVIAGKDDETIIFGQKELNKQKVSVYLYEFNLKTKAKNELFAQAGITKEASLWAGVYTAHGVVAVRNDYEVNSADLNIKLVLIQNGQATPIAQEKGPSYDHFSVAEL